MLRFVAYLKARKQVRDNNMKDPTAAEWKEAEDSWVKSIQRNTFTEEYQAGDTVHYKGQLILFSNDEQIICCKGRLNQSDLSTSMKNRFCFPLSIDSQSYW